MNPMEQRALDLAREMIRIDTCNPPGNETPVAQFLADTLKGAGFEIRFDEFAPGRPNLIASLPGQGKPLCLSGHMDTVPLGGAPWREKPFGAEIKDGNLYGRGSADMKGGLAAIASAALELARLPQRKAGLLLAFSGDEETGCKGAGHLAAAPELLAGSGAILVAEPSDCIPRLGHKGSFWYLGKSAGKAAHGSMPQEGVNAIYKAARAIGRLSQYSFQGRPHPVLGSATLNVGTMTGGTKINMVPDSAEFAIDVRTIPGQTQEDIFRELSLVLGEDAELSLAQKGAGAVWTEASHPWVARVFKACEKLSGEACRVRGLSYFTDASALAGALPGAPVVILGPGAPEQAHQTDEHCPVEQIALAAGMYLEIGRDWMSA